MLYNLFNYNANNNWASYYDMLIVLSGANLCINKGGGTGHSTAIYGVCPDVPSSYCIERMITILWEI